MNHRVPWAWIDANLEPQSSARRGLSHPRYGAPFSYSGVLVKPFECLFSVSSADITCRVMVLSAVGRHRRIMGSEASASPCCIRGRPHPGCLEASPQQCPRDGCCLVPTRDITPPVGGSSGATISCRLSLLVGPAEVGAIVPHAMEDDDVLDNGAKFGLPQMDLRRQDRPGRSPEPHHRQPRCA